MSLSVSWMHEHAHRLFDYIFNLILFVQIGDFLCFAETNFCNQDRLAFRAGN